MKRRNLLLAGCLSYFLATWGQSNRPFELRLDLLANTELQSTQGFIIPSSRNGGAFAKNEGVKILTSSPSFCWNLPVGDMQTRYQILVASSEKNLKEGKADCWDSGVVRSRQSSGVEYKGTPLRGGRVYYWTVRTWNQNDTPSGFAKSEAFYTDKILQPHATARYPIQKEQELPVKITPKANGLFADFGKDAFCSQLYLTLSTDSDSDTVTVHVGEAKKEGAAVDRDPDCKIRYYAYQIPLQQGKHTYQINFRRGGGSIKTPDYIGSVVPFRYVEVDGCNGTNVTLTRNAVFYPYNDAASYFNSPDTVLNKVWDLCKYSVKATSFTGQFIDGDRERKPYEGDNYIGQLTAYCVDDEYNLPRYSHEYSMHKATWPTEWILISVMNAWYDYLYTGDLRSLRYYYNDLKAKCLMDFETDKHLISVSGTKKRKDPAIMAKIYHRGGISDIIDWPSRDGYVGGKYKSVINAYYYRDLILMARMAAALGKKDDVAFFQKKAAQVKNSFQSLFWDKKRKLFVDSDTTSHASLHANFFPLAFGLVTETQRKDVMDYIRSRGMACSIFGAQFLLEAVYAGEDGTYGRSLMNSTQEKSWYNMIREGSTITMEAWGNKYKGNQDWNHIWGAAPGNIIIRNLIGVKPTQAGWNRFEIRPQLGGLPWAKAKVPTIKGAVYVSYSQDTKSFKMNVSIPGNTEADVILPIESPKSVFINGEKAKFQKKNGKTMLPILKSGRYNIVVDTNI